MLVVARLAAVRWPNRAEAIGRGMAAPPTLEDGSLSTGGGATRRPTCVRNRRSYRRTAASAEGPADISEDV